MKVSVDRLINLSSWLSFDINNLNFELMCGKSDKGNSFPV